MIRVQGVSKRFRIYASPVDRLKEKLFRRLYHHEYNALSDISFEVGPGETLGIIGENGAGKSTLLKILSGVLIPDSGVVEVSGKVTGLLELGTGFNPELSGYDNIFMNGTFLGMSHAEIEAKKDTIIEFAELGEFIHEPIKTYSSGMMMRLGFAIAIHADPECFLVDEALSVGDAYFQQKCMRKIQEFKEQGGSIIFVSHDMNAVATLCDHAILLVKGEIISYGSPKSIIDQYMSRLCIQLHHGEKEITIKRDHGEDKKYNISTNEIEFLSLQLLNLKNDIISHISTNDEVSFVFTFKCIRDINEPTIGILIRNRLGVKIFGINTYLMGKKLGVLYQGLVYKAVFYLTVPLQPDEYTITFGIDNQSYGINSSDEYLLRLNDVGTLKVVKKESTPIFEGMIDLHPSFSLMNV